MNDLNHLVPQDKYDLERANAALAAGYLAIAPILPELLVWIQDMNWPVARVLAPFLVTIGKPLAPHIRLIFETDDAAWKEWIVTEVIAKSPELAAELRADLERVASLPALTGDWSSLLADDEDNEIFKQTVRDFLVAKSLGD